MTIEERARELWGKLPIIQEDYIPVIQAALEEQKAIDMESICKLEEAVKAFRAFCHNILNGIYIDNEIAAVEQLRYIETNYNNDVDWDSIEK